MQRKGLKVLPLQFTLGIDGRVIVTLWPVYRREERSATAGLEWTVVDWRAAGTLESQESRVGETEIQHVADTIQHPTRQHGHRSITFQTAVLSLENLVQSSLQPKTNSCFSYCKLYPIFCFQ